MGNKQNCSIDFEVNKYLCEQCSSFICEKCLEIHVGHTVKNLECVLFELSAKISQVVSKLDSDIHHSIAFTKYNDISQYFTSCNSAFNYLKSQINEIQGQLQKLEKVVLTVIEKAAKEAESLVNIASGKKIEFLTLNKEISEVLTKPDFYLMSKTIIRANNFINPEPTFNFSQHINIHEKLSKNQSELQSLLKGISDNIVSMTQEFSNNFLVKIDTNFVNFMENSIIGKNVGKIKSFGKEGNIMPSGKNSPKYRSGKYCY